MRVRAALAVAAALITAVSLSAGPVRWPWLLSASMVLSLAGIALGGLTTLGASHLPRALAVARVAAAGLVTLGWYLLSHADHQFAGWPEAPLLSHSLTLPSPLGAAVAAAGLVLLAAGQRPRDGRRLVVAGALALGAEVLFPETRAGSLTLPLIESVRTGGAALVLATAMVVALGALASGELRGRTRTAAGALAGGVALLLIFPAWLLWTGQLRGALVTGAEEIAVANALVLLFGPLPDETAAPSLIRAAEWGAIVLLACVWWLLKIHGLGYAVTDEYIYFYAAKAWSEGLWPYRDFFFSHPPLHLALPMALFRAFGFHHLLAKLLAPTVAFLTALLLWRGARRHFGWVAGVGTFALFLFATDVLRSSTTFTGMELTTFFLAGGILAALDRHAFRAGLWFAASACSGVYGLAGFLTFGVLSLAAPGRATPLRWRSLRADAARMLGGFLAVFVPVNLGFYGLAGSRFIDGVYRYHLLKPAKNAAQHAMSLNPWAVVYNLGVLLGGQDFRTQLYYHADWYVLAGVALCLGVASRTVSWRPRSWWAEEPGRINAAGAALLLVFSGLGTLAELGSFQERYDYYFVLMFPALSLLGGFALGQVARALDRATDSPALLSSWGRPAVLLGCLMTCVPLSAWASRTSRPEEYDARGGSRGAGEVLSIDWTPSPVLPGLGEIAHALFWSDTRVRGEIHSGVSHFLWSKKRFFETAPAVASYVESHTSPEDTITGGSEMAPLIALLSHRRLAGDQIDTNGKVFGTGVVAEQDYWASVCHDRVAYLVLGEDLAFSTLTIRSRFGGQFFQPEATFQDHGIRQRRVIPIELWRRIKEPPEPTCGQ